MEDGTLPSQRPSETLIQQPAAEEEGFVENGSNAQSRPSDTGIRILGIVSGLTMTALVLSSAGLITGQNLLSQLFAAPPRVNPHQSAGQNEESVANGQLAPAFTEKATETLAGSTASYSAVRPDSESTAPHGQATSTQSPEAATDSTSGTSGRPLRAVLLREPESRGWGNSYAVRLFNSAGRPMQVFGVLLVARMADGSVQETAMGTLAEPGVYRGTVPTGRSTPVALRVRVRVRVSNGERFVEIPVTR
jgi:hypothetical protein